MYVKERQIRNKNQADTILHMEDPQHGSSPLFPWLYWGCRSSTEKAGIPVTSRQEWQACQWAEKHDWKYFYCDYHVKATQKPLYPTVLTRKPARHIFEFRKSPRGIHAPLALVCHQRKCRSQAPLQLSCRSQLGRAAVSRLVKTQRQNVSVSVLSLKK